jgi:hypothetical protein
MMKSFFKKFINLPFTVKAAVFVLIVFFIYMAIIAPAVIAILTAVFLVIVSLIRVVGYVIDGR